MLGSQEARGNTQLHACAAAVNVQVHVCRCVILWVLQVRGRKGAGFEIWPRCAKGIVDDAVQRDGRHVVWTPGSKDCA